MLHGQANDCLQLNHCNLYLQTEMLLPTEITVTCIEMLVARHPSKSQESVGSSKVLQILSPSWLLLHARDGENAKQSSVVNNHVN